MAALLHSYGMSIQSSNTSNEFDTSGVGKEGFELNEQRVVLFIKKTRTSDESCVRACVCVFLFFSFF